MDREKKFRVALLMEGITAAEFGRRLGKTPAAISLTVRGKSESAEINAAIDALIDKHFPEEVST